MKRIRQAIRALRKELAPWGPERPRASKASGVATVVVFVETRGGRRTLGTLMREGKEFVFRYDPQFTREADAKPISAFPDMAKEYRSEELWPFFSVRLPPVDREDVREAMRRRHIPQTDVLRLLAELSGRGVSSPYRFSMAVQGA